MKMVLDWFVLRKIPHVTKYLKKFVADFQPFVFNFNVILSRLKVALSKD